MKALDVDVVVRRGAFLLEAAFGVAAGERIALVGPNGAGKSTALRAIAGLTPIERGAITLGARLLDDGRDSVAAEQRGVALAFADRRLFPHMTARANVAFAARTAGASHQAAHVAADGWLERFGLTSLAGRKPDELSSGQAQRVTLARALAQNPDALLLDEPTTALDAETRDSVRAELKRHLEEVAVPTVIVTHDPREANELADRVVVLEAGRVVQVASPAELAAAPATNYVRQFLAGHG